MARLKQTKSPFPSLRRLRRSPCNPLKSLAELCCGGAEVHVQVIEIIAEALRNVLSPITPYELPQRFEALRSSFPVGSQWGRS
jgi:hypothetical protein